MVTTVRANGREYTDDSNPLTGMGNGGHRTRLMPMLNDVMAETAAKLSEVRSKADEAANSASQAAADKGIIAQYKTDTYNYMVSAQTAAANAQSWDPTNYVKKDGSVQFTGPVGVKANQEWPHQSFFVSGDAGMRGHYMTARARGTVASPSAVLNGDTLGGIGVGGHDGNGYTYGWNGGGELSLYATENWTPTSKGAKWGLSTTAKGGAVLTERLSVDEYGLTLAAGHKISTASGNTQVQAPDGSTVVLGGGQTAQFPRQAEVAESSHATSKRATFGIGTIWSLMSDLSGNGTRDFGIYSSSLAATILKFLVNGTAIFNRAVTSNPVNVTWASTITLDASLGNTFRVTLAGPTTFALPTNLTDGQIITLEITQDSTGSRTGSWASGWNFGANSLTLTTTAGKTDIVVARAVGTTKLQVIAVKGF